MMLKLVRFILSCVGLILVITACAEKPVVETPVLPAPPPPPSEREVFAELINKRVQKPHAETEALDVLYVTNRELKDAKAGCSNKAYTVSQGKGLLYGFCRLNMPKKSRVGSIQATDDPRADSHTYYRVQGHKALPNEQVKAAILEKEPEGILLFTHGFNVKFEEAVMRAGQIAYDLKFQGLPMVFTWPAGSEDGFAAGLINKTYEKNFQAAQASQADAVALLRWLKTINLPIFLAVHSMGHQVIIPALDKLSAEFEEPFIEELILNAPDLSVDDFQKFAASLKKVAKRVTVYCSFNDNAIAASETFNSNRRLGACATAEGIDVINVGEVDAPTLGLGLGHGYYSSRPIITDVYQLLLGVEAEKRLFLRRSEPNSVENYYLRP
jgi:esterase/lipase superfamily enzyme